MIIVELIKECKEAIDDPNRDGKISLVIPGCAGRGNYKYFPGTKIKGEIICEYENSCLCAFDAQKLMDKILSELPTLKLKGGENE